MKFAQPIPEEIRITLQEMYMNHPTFRCRQRAQAILLSVRGFTLIQLWSILDVRRDAISEWITRWEEEGLIGLYDRPRSGCPPIYTETEVALLKTLVDEEPRQIKTAQTKLADITQKVASTSTLKRLLKKKFQYLWKRMRKSLKDKRDPVAFEREKEIQAFLHQQVAAGKLLIYYFDGSGFTTTPCVPYGWQKRGETCRLPTAHSKRLNVLGFMSVGNDSFFHTVEGRVDSQAAIAAFDAFAARYAEEFAQTKIPCFVILDNAPIHTSKAFLGKRDDWMLAGICLHFLPTYSPELNPIEILWRKIKYEWLPLGAYKSYKDMKEQVLAILAGFGKKYTITF